MLTERKNTSFIEPFTGLKLLINSEDIIAHKKGISFIFPESTLYLQTEQNTEFYKKRHYVVIPQKQVDDFITKLNRLSLKDLQAAISFLAERNLLSPQELYEKLSVNNELLYEVSQHSFRLLHIGMGSQQNTSMVIEEISEPLFGSLFEQTIIEDIHLATALSITCKALYNLYLQTINNLKMKRGKSLCLLYKHKDYSVSPKAQKQTDLINYLKAPITENNDTSTSFFTNYLPIIDLSREDSTQTTSWYCQENTRFLKIANITLSPDSLAMIATLKNLQTCILENLHLPTISFLNDLPIKRLSLKGSFIEEDRLEPHIGPFEEGIRFLGSQKSFKKFPAHHLEVLDLSKCFSIHRSVMKAISKIQSLKAFFLNEQRFAINYLFYLAKLPNLSYISLENCENEGRLLGYLKEEEKSSGKKSYFQATSLSLNSCSFAKKKILQLLEYFPNLETLSIQKTKITNIQPIIDRCPLLEKIDLSFCKISKKELNLFFNSHVQIITDNPVSTAELKARFAQLSL